LGADENAVFGQIWAALIIAVLSEGGSNTQEPARRFAGEPFSSRPRIPRCSAAGLFVLPTLLFCDIKRQPYFLGKYLHNIPLRFSIPPPGYDGLQKK
jgi:hypothetical protein